MNIGIDITTMGGIRGPGRVTRELILSLARRESDDRFFLYTPLEPPAIGLPENFAVRRVPMRRGLPWLNLSLPLAAAKDRIDVMLFPSNDCWMLPFRKTVAVVLDIAQRTHLRDDLRPIDRLQNDLQLFMLPLAAKRVAAISDFTAKQLVQLKPSLAGRITVVHLGVNAAFGPQGKASPVRGDYILFVSGFDKRKNVEGLLGAFKILRQRGRNERLLLKGVVEQGIAYYQDIPAMVRARGLEGAVDIDSTFADDGRLAELYRGAAMLVVPSLVEGFGLPVLEAMACGCPVACSSAASLPEVGGEAALYFDPRNVEEMASAMGRILNEPGLRESMIENGFQNVRRFSWDRMAGEVMALVYSLGGKSEKAGHNGGIK